MREIRTLRAMWRELETESRSVLNGNEGGNPDTDKAAPKGHRASSRPYHSAKQISFQPKLKRQEACASGSE